MTINLVWISTKPAVSCLTCFRQGRPGVQVIQQIIGRGEGIADAWLLGPAGLALVGPRGRGFLGGQGLRRRGGSGSRGGAVVLRSLLLGRFLGGLGAVA